jgi:hypothetical protein
MLGERVRPELLGDNRADAVGQIGQVVAEIELGRGCHDRVYPCGKALGLAGIKATIKSLGGRPSRRIIAFTTDAMSTILQPIKQSRDKPRMSQGRMRWISAISP